MNQRTVFRLALVGDAKVGKRQIRNCFLHHVFSDTPLSTVSANSKDGKITQENNSFSIKLGNTRAVLRYFFKSDQDLSQSQRTDSLSTQVLDAWDDTSPDTSPADSLAASLAASPATSPATSSATSPATSSVTSPATPPPPPTVLHHVFSDIPQQNNNFSIQLWDTDSVLFFDREGTPFLQGSDAIAIVLDGTQSAEKQKKSMSHWVARIKQSEPTALIYFIVNKIDIAPKFVGEDAFNTAVTDWNEAKKQEDKDHQDIPVMFCSAKTEIGIDTALNRIEKDCVAKKHKKLEENTNNDPISPDAPVSSESPDAPVSSESPDAPVSSDKPPSPINVYFSQSRFLKELEEKISDNKVRAGGNAFFLALLILLLIIAAFPLGGFLAVGSLSALAVAGLIGGGVLLLWNVACSVVNDLQDRADTLSSEIDNPSSKRASVSPTDKNNSEYKAGMEFFKNKVSQLAVAQGDKKVQPSAENPNSQEDGDSAEEKPKKLDLN